jgi:broad specificity phosphatase PhoE
VQGQLDAGLSEHGWEQVRRLGARLAGGPPDAVYASDLARAWDTAEALPARSPVVPEPRLREARFGAFEGLTLEEAEARFPEAFAAWRRDSVRHRPPGGETLEELQARCAAALQEHLPRHPGQTVALVAHGGPIRMLVCALLRLPLEASRCLRVENASVTRVEFTVRAAVLAALNDTAHLRE